MKRHDTIGRRSVLKAIGATAAGGVALTGAASAGNPGNNRRMDTFTWMGGELFEMLDAEPPAVQDFAPGQIDSEGNHNAHRPLWLVGSMDDYSDAENVDGTEHSPHPNPLGARVDHVVPEKGPGFTAQWHVHLLVRDQAEVNEFFGLLQSGDELELLKFLNGLPHGDGDGNIVNDADVIRDAVEAERRVEVPLFLPSGEPDVFTCPVRPHKHTGSNGHD